MGPSEAARTQVGLVLATRPLLSGHVMRCVFVYVYSFLFQWHGVAIPILTHGTKSTFTKRGVDINDKLWTLHPGTSFTNKNTLLLDCLSCPNLSQTMLVKWIVGHNSVDISRALLINLYISICFPGIYMLNRFTLCGCPSIFLSVDHSTYNSPISPWKIFNFI